MLAEPEFQEACSELIEAEREFVEWDAKAHSGWAHPDHDPTHLARGSTHWSGATKPTSACRRTGVMISAL